LENLYTCLQKYLTQSEKGGKSYFQPFWKTCHNLGQRFKLLLVKLETENGIETSVIFVPILVQFKQNILIIIINRKLAQIVYFQKIYILSILFLVRVYKYYER
jgi:hypothetical protein